MDCQAILCVDAHLDIELVTQEELEAFPTDLLKLARQRVGAHSEIRRATGGFPALVKEKSEIELMPEMWVTVPIGALGATAKQKNEVIGKTSHESMGETARALLKHYKESMGILVHLSPPRRLSEIRRRLLGDVIFDIDVDYFNEMQAECYSPSRNAGPSDLASIIEMMHLIKNVNPKLITISEETVESREKPSSSFNGFLEWLKKRGYSIQCSQVFATDTEARQTLALYDEYCNTIRLPMLKDATRTHLAGGPVDLTEVSFQKSLSEKTRLFFGERIPTG